MEGSGEAMSTEEEPTNTVGGMGHAEMGESIRQRRMALGLTVKALAERAGVDRGRLAAIEDGASARSSTIGAVNAVLARLEEEMSGPYDEEPRDGNVVIRLSGKPDVEVVVQGPVTNLAELEASAERLLRGMRERNK